MKRKPFALRGPLLSCLCISGLFIFMTACAGGDKKGDAPGGQQPRQELPAGQALPVADEDGPTEGDTIPKEAADKMIAEYKGNVEQLLNGTYRGQAEIMPDSETFSKSIIDSVLKQPGVAKLRIYFCMDTTSSKKIKVLLVGVDKDGRDVFSTGTGRYATPPPPIIVEEGTRQP